MVKVILGEKGTGKTKALLDRVHEAVVSEKGSVVFINNGNRHIYDVSHKIRLVDTAEYDMHSFEGFYGLLCGIVAQNYDVSYIFIDGLLKIAKGSAEEMEVFLDKANALCEKFNIQMAISISIDPAKVSDKVKAYA